MFLALWVLSPCLLLHARMARSYSMQLALASLAIYTALQWAEQPRNLKRLLAIRWLERRTSLYALLVWTGCCGRSVRGVSAQKTVHIGRGAVSIAVYPLCTLAANPRYHASARELSAFPVRMKAETSSPIKSPVSLIYSYLSASAKQSPPRAFS